MGDQFSVDTGELGHFLRTLEEAHSSLDEVRKKMQDVTPDGIGTKDLDSACNDFQEHWKYGSEQLAEQTGKFADAVGQSKSNYEEIEIALEGAFKRAAAKGVAK